MTTGKRAFGGDTAALVKNAILTQQLPAVAELNPKVPTLLEQVISKALEKDRDERYATAVDMLDALKHVRVTAEADAHAAPGRMDKRHGDPFRINLRWTGAAVIIVLAIGGICLAIWQNADPAPRISNYEQITHDGLIKDLCGTDGSRLYFTQWRTPRAIAEVSETGGVISQIPVSLPVRWLSDVSPDGSKLLVFSQDRGRRSMHPLWVVPVLGSPARFLADGVSATWSPDGKTIVYSTDSGDLYLVAVDASGNRKLASPGGDVRFISWSPDGATIRFSKDGRLWEITSQGSNLHEVLAGWGGGSLRFAVPGRPYSHWGGTWTADGKFIFESDSQIFVLDERRSLLRNKAAKPVQITSGPINWERAIPSKDGKKIFASGAIHRGELLRFDTKSGHLVPFLGGISAQYVSFSKDSRFVAYVSYPEEILWRANQDGSNPVQLTDSSMTPRLPRWSPDGDQILFVDFASGGISAIYTIPSQGGESAKAAYARGGGTANRPELVARREESSVFQQSGRGRKSEIRLAHPRHGQPQGHSRSGFAGPLRTSLASGRTIDRGRDAGCHEPAAFRCCNRALVAAVLRTCRLCQVVARQPVYLLDSVAGRSRRGSYSRRGRQRSARGRSL
jgi:dipeptidyl aminopeptidase/acylaminoacyl peptidase